MAMQKGNYPLAQQLISQAERTPPGSRPAQDSPERARRALAILQGKASSETPVAVTPLLAARRALAEGKLDETKAYMAESRQKGITQDVTGDTLAAVEQMLIAVQRHNDDTSLAGPDRLRRHADLLLDQAEGLMRHGDLRTAGRLADFASTLRVEYGPNQRTPQMVVNAIADRQSNGGGERLPQQLDEVNNRIASARQMVGRARMEMDRNNLEGAKQLALQANQMRVQLPAGETQPWQLVLEIADRERRARTVPSRYDVTQAVATTAGEANAVGQSVYQSGNDNSMVRPAQATQPTPATLSPPPISQGVRLFQSGLSALQDQQQEQALDLFRQAWKYEAELDPNTRRELVDKINLLGNVTVPTAPNRNGGSALEEVTAQEQIARQQLFQEITNEQKMAERQKESDPIGALNRLESLQGRVGQAKIDDRTKQQFLRIVNADLNRLRSFIAANRADIESTERNRAVLDSIERDRMALMESQDKLAELVGQFNILMDERRFHEAEIIAKQAKEIAPNDPVSENLAWKSQFARAVAYDQETRAMKEEGVRLNLQDVDRSATMMHPDRPLVFADNWLDLSASRLRTLKRQSQRYGAEELKIQENLQQKVDVSFENMPLDQVLHTLTEMAGIPVFIDPVGLSAEAVVPDTPITIQLSKPVSLRAALNLILQPLQLSYVINNEVLRVTSETARQSDTSAQTYNVADLVIPIPNFAPLNFGIPAAMGDQTSMGFGTQPGQTSGLPALSMSGNQGPMNASVAYDTSQFGTANVAAQGNFGMANGASLRSRPTQSFNGGPGGTGGAALADFDTLVNLITRTVSPDSWEENGGNGAIEPYPANLSLVISTTQEVHEEIAQLLEQLREWQDLQVTIEVRFITLNDNFFERIGIDFDFQIDDNSGLDPQTPVFTDDHGKSVAFGLDPTGAPTSDLDIQFLQDGFASAVPQFGGFDATSVSNFGFAILSDIEVFFLMQAATGDRRTNVLSAPRVTLFNGQQANVNDLSLRPFVTQIVPVVGDFAVGQQPIVTVLGEGTSLNVQAVVSSDRRFVRLTLVPFFSEIGAVDTFTFTGRTETSTGSNVVDATGNPTGNTDNVTTVTEGSTVQLPTISFTTVTTTVNVPDGGTVLLGGIKRLSEGRNERGVPMLAQLPYISRLFKNVGIGRDTQSLMLMVTPRIIIQREEEERLVGAVGE